MMIKCCNNKYYGQEFKVRTREAIDINNKIEKANDIKDKDKYKYLIGEEFTEISQCKVCHTKLINLNRYNVAGEHLASIDYRGKKAIKLLDEFRANKSKIIQKRYKEKNIDRRFGLPYADRCVKKICYSNISSLLIGLIDLDPFKTDKRYFIGGREACR